MTDDPWKDRAITSTGDLALFLGGSETSFTGLLLDLITKAQATPKNYSRLKLAFLDEVHAWEMWQSMSPAPTFGQLREALDAEREEAIRPLRETAAKADPVKVSRMMSHVNAQIAALEPELRRMRQARGLEAADPENGDDGN